MQISLGTLLRCPHITEERLAFYHNIGLNMLQLAGVNEEYLAPGKEAEQKSDALFELFRKYGFSVPTMFLFFPEQDWSRPDETIGLTPEPLRAERMVFACRQMLWGKKYGIKYITCHVGHFPEKESEAYGKLINDLRQIILFAESNGQSFLFETGMENTVTMQQIITDLAPAEPMINFDPANLLLYDQDAPEQFLDELENRVKVVHCKDAVRPQAGPATGRETVLGEGETGFRELLKRLLKNGFSGPLVIERELPPGEEQERDIAGAVKLIKNICEEV